MATAEHGVVERNRWNQQSEERTMGKELEGVRIAFVVANEGVERSELTEPWRVARDAGAEPVLAAPKADEVRLFEHLDPSEAWTATVATTELSADHFAAVMLPGGVANADELRTDDAAVVFLRQMMQDDKPVAVICHGSWTLIETGALRGRTLTSWPSLRTDIENAGGSWVDEEVHVDGHLVTSRKPDDLPAFCRQMLAAFTPTR
jgi:deglycase